MTINPAPVNHGIKFQRVDLADQPIIDAIADYVTATSRGTTLEKNGAKISTLEHVMASLSGMGIDNALITINAPEVPIMDGSAREYVKAIREVGVEEQDADRWYFEVKEKIVYRDEESGKEIVILPDDHFSVETMIDFNSKVLGNQYARLSNIKDFADEIAPCRTFVFLHEVEFLLKNNLIKGGDLENAIVVVENEVSQETLDHLAALFNKPSINVLPEGGYLNNLQLRFPNEPARHKLLDMVGDFALVGYPIKGKIIANKPGHFVNTEMAKAIRKIAKKAQMKPDAPEYDPNKEPLIDINGIRKILPHRPPFLLVDKIISRTETSVVGVKNVTMNEPFFVGHFPEEPVMPGVLIIEAMAQVGGLLALASVPDPENYSTYFVKIDKVRFKRKVVPGDTLVFKLELTEPIRRGMVMMNGKAYVGDALATEAELMAQIIKNKQ